MKLISIALALTAGLVACGSEPATKTSVSPLVVWNKQTPHLVGGYDAASKTISITAEFTRLLATKNMVLVSGDTTIASGAKVELKEGDSILVKDSAKATINEVLVESNDTVKSLTENAAGTSFLANPNDDCLMAM
ncbi:MAG: hypothetical protein U1E65_15640 [Myxococcota bacterium]